MARQDDPSVQKVQGVLEHLHSAEYLLELEINATASGSGRNKLADANIFLKECKQKLLALIGAS